jgi:hypothetical protein
MDVCDAQPFILAVRVQGLWNEMLALLPTLRLCIASCFNSS